MQREEIATFQTLDTLQKDIERVLKPYGILNSKPYRRGYYVGTGVFNASKLNRIYNALQSIASHSDDPEKAAEIIMELWVTADKYSFIAEGTQRFPRKQLKLSKPPERTLSTLDEKLFCLKDTGNAAYPHRLQVILPVWSLRDVELQKWILGFGGHIRVLRPDALHDAIAAMGKAIASGHSHEVT